MVEIRQAHHLEVGDHFIWATHQTRVFAVINFGSDLQVLKCLNITADRLPGGIFSHKLHYRRLDRTENFVRVSEGCHVAVINKSCSNFDPMVTCIQCGKSSGAHFPGVDARTEGIQCNYRGSGSHFVPHEPLLRKYHKFPAEEDFFASLGL